MENEPDFAKFVYEELAIGLMQKLVKTSSFDTNVSLKCVPRLHVHFLEERRP